MSEENQKYHFRKGQAEVIAYYPLQGEQVISSVKEIMTQDIKENLEDKENLVFLLYGETGFDFKRDCQPKCDENKSMI